MYYEACDLLSGELEDCFKTDHIEPILCMEQVLLKAANKQEFKTEIRKIEQSCFSKDFDFTTFKRQLPLLHDVIQVALPSVKTVTLINIICDAINSCEAYKDLLSSIHQLLRLILTIPITSATAERTFSALKNLHTYLQSMMTEKKINNCLLLHVDKELTDDLNLKDIAKEFFTKHDERKKYF